LAIDFAATSAICSAGAGADPASRLRDRGPRSGPIERRLQRRGTASSSAARSTCCSGRGELISTRGRSVAGRFAFLLGPAWLRLRARPTTRCARSSAKRPERARRGGRCGCRGARRACHMRDPVYDRRCGRLRLKHATRAAENTSTALSRLQPQRLVRHPGRT